MKEALLAYIVCPDCRQELELAAVRRTTDEIDQGQLRCRGCDKTYPIEDGLVYLVPEERLAYCRQENAAHEQSMSEGFFGWVKGEIFLNWPHQMPPGVEGELENEIRSHSQSFARVMELIRGDEVVLDFGAGFGWASRDFARRGCTAIAVDVSSFLLRRARDYIDHYHVYFERAVADMECLPFRDEVFDLVFGCAAIHHSCDLDRTIGEMARVIRPGRQVITIKDHLRPAYMPPEEWKDGDRDAAHGINENSFNYLEYLRAFWRSGLQAEIKPSRHYWAELFYGQEVAPYAHRPFPIRAARTLKHWLSNGSLVDIFARKIGRPRPLVCALLRTLARPTLRTPLFLLTGTCRLLCSERDIPLCVTLVRASTLRVRRETVYEVELANHDTAPRSARLTLDIFPWAHGRHPERHMGWWTKVVPLAPGEKKRVRILFNSYYRQARFCVRAGWEWPGSQWQGEYFQPRRFYRAGVHVYDEQGNRVHGQVLVQQFLE